MRRGIPYIGMRALHLLLDLCFPARATERLVARAPLDALRDECRGYAAFGPDVPATALLPYRLPLAQACILEGKFHGNARAQALLAAVLEEYLREFLHADAALAPRPVILVPVPLSRARLQERGYNQAERYAQLAARACAGELRVAPELLERTRDTPPQTSLDGARRRKNLAGAFAAHGPLSPHDTYIVFDDVITTGATLSAACAALAKAGARRLAPLALAY